MGDHARLFVPCVYVCVCVCLCVSVCLCVRAHLATENDLYLDPSFISVILYQPFEVTKHGEPFLVLTTCKPHRDNVAQNEELWPIKQT